MGMTKVKFPISDFQFSKGKRAHLIGIKGVAMTALAQILQARGVLITGSDGPEHFFTDAILKKLGIKYAQKFSPENIPADVDVVISSAAYLHAGQSLDNVEVSAALKRALPTFSYPQIMSALTQEYRTIGIAGSHGKSTTTAMAGWMLEKCKTVQDVLQTEKEFGVIRKISDLTNYQRLIVKETHVGLIE